MVPTVPEARLLTGLAKFGRFNKLKNSPRNCRLLVSVTVKFFINPKSTLANPGPTRVFRPKVPNVNTGLGSNASGLKYLRMSCPRSRPVCQSLFPQLIAGPIVRYRTIAAQLVRRTHNWERLASGASLFILGFSKKILLANPIGAVADAVLWAESAGALEAWFGVTAYAFQIYFDFSGYSDMALGLGAYPGL